MSRNITVGTKETFDQTIVFKYYFTYIILYKCKPTLNR